MKQAFVYTILLLLFYGCAGHEMKEKLLLTDSLNQAGAPLDTITFMQDVVNYYDTWGTADNQVTAHYLLGCVFRDQNNTPMALRCFRDAISYADTTDADCNFHQLSRIYGQMADLFHRQRSPRLEIQAEQQAVNYAWKAKDTLAAITFYGYLSCAYHMLNKMDSVLYVIHHTEQGFMNIGRNDLAASFLPMTIDVLTRNHQFKEAKSVMDRYEQCSGFFDSSGNIQPNKMIYLKYKGAYYENMGKLDSAEYYYRKMLTHQPDLNRKESGYRGLFSIYSRLKQPDSIAKYAYLYCQTNDSASFVHSADEIVRAQALYDYEEHQRIAERKKREAEYYKNLIVISSFILCLLAIIVYRYYKKQQQRKKAELMRMNTEYASLLHQYEQLQHDVRLSQDDMNLYRKEKEQEILVLLQKLALYQDVPLMMERWNIETAMLDSSVVSELHHLARQAKQPSGKQWKELRELVEKELPDFFKRIDSKEACLSPQEVLTSILIRLQFSQGELSALFGVSKQRVNNIKRSINQKLFAEESAATLNQNIANM